MYKYNLNLCKKKTTYTKGKSKTVIIINADIVVFVKLNIIFLEV